MKFLSLYQDTKIIFWGPDEVDTWQNVKKFKTYIEKICLERNLAVEFWEGNFRKQIPVNSKKIKVLNWSTFCATYTLQFDYKSQHKLKPTKLLTSLNRSALPHKCAFIDIMAKYNLIKNNVVSWHRHDYNQKYNFKYFDNEKIIIDNINHPAALYSYPPDYHLGHIDLICESHPATPDISEKTFKAIAAKKIFLSVGYKGFYKQMQRLGFKLYTEIFDYDFDCYESFSARAENAVKQVSKIKNLNNLYPMVQHKIDFNYNIFLKISHNVPEEFKVFIKKHKVEHYNDLFDYFNNLPQNK